MPNQSDPNQNTPVNDPVIPPVIPNPIDQGTLPSMPILDESDIPPIPAGMGAPPTITDSGVPDPPTVPVGTTVTEIDQTSPTGSAAPTDLPPMVAGPKKKFGTGKIIATILGLFLLIGGVGAGVFLVGQNQDINEKAGCYSTCMNQVGDPDECDFVCKSKTEKPTSVEKPVNKWKDDCACGVNATGTACKSCEKEPEQGGKCGYCDDNSTCVSCSGGRISVGECSSSSQCAKVIGSSCPAPGKIVSGKCVPPSNCQSNTGNCYVKTKIGVGEGDKQVCDGPHWTTCAEGYICSNEDCVPSGIKTTKSSDNQTTTTTTTTTTTSSTAQCQNIKTYSPTWTLLTSTQLSALTVGSQVNFCVTGSASSGSFDKAKFTINGVVQAETTTVRPGSTDFCQLYNIPVGATTFNVTAQIHHVTLGWR